MPYTDPHLSPSLAHKATFRQTLYNERLLDMIPGGIVWATLFVCIVLAIILPEALLIIACLLAIYMSVRFALVAFMSIRGLRDIQRWQATDWHERYQQTSSPNCLPWGSVYHLIMIPNYNEPLSILAQTLQNLIKCDMSERFIVVLAMEERDETHRQKADALTAQFSAHFAEFFVTVHPRDIPGEIAAKSPNLTWAVRSVTPQLTQAGYDPDHIVLTTMDADTLWHKKHFSALTYHFATRPQRHNTIWQAPIRYQANVHDIHPPLRLLNAVASGFELAYVASSFWRTMPISSYALSLKLVQDADYWDVDVVSDEYHMLVKAYFAREGELHVAPILLPFLASSPVTDSITETARIRYNQTLRHAWASKETGYMIAQMLRYPHVVQPDTWQLLFRLAHDVLLAGAGWIVLALGTQLPFLLHPRLIPPVPDVLHTPEILLAYPHVICLTAVTAVILLATVIIWVQDIRVRPKRQQPPTPRERFWALLALPLLPILTVIFVALPTLHAQTKLLLGQSLAFRVTPKG